MKEYFDNLNFLINGKKKIKLNMFDFDPSFI